MLTKTLHIRIKNNLSYLDQLANEVNFVWNYVNELTAKAWKRDRHWLTHYDVAKYTSGATKEGISIGSATIQSINEEHFSKRKQRKRAKLKWRTKKSLGWIPFKTAQIRYKNGLIIFNKHKFKCWDSYGLSNYELRTGNFAQDAKGNWFLNVTVQFQPKDPIDNNKSIGIDLGLKTLATYSNGDEFKTEQWYRQSEAKLALAQKTHNKKRIKNIHTKIKNQRKDNLHKESTRLVKTYSKIAIGNVSSQQLAKTKMAKSVLDAGWGLFKTMLEYKSHWASAEFKIVNEAYSTQTCSNCGCISGPKGLKSLGIRQWVCSDCGTEHQRDVNAAKNILNVGFGHEPLAEGIIVL